MEQKIFSLVNEAMKKIGIVGKDKKNTQGSGYNYRGIDDVVASCSIVMQEFGLILSSEILSGEREERQSKSGGTLIYTIIRYRFKLYAPDGSFITTEKQGEAMDSGDKGSNKAYASAEKYALCELFMIPTYSNDDVESETHEVKPQKKNFTEELFEKFKPKKDRFKTAGEAIKTLEETYFMADNAKKLIIELYDEEANYPDFQK